MKIWNFKNQDLEEGIELPACNVLGGKYFPPVNISYNSTDGETVIEYFGEKENEREIDR
jgi:hypothetical protein